MKIFFDTEFIEDGKTIDLISIGMVREDGKELYLENMDCDLTQANGWVCKNVLPYLHRCKVPHGPAKTQMGDGEYEWIEELGSEDPSVVPKWQIANRVRAFVGPNPEFWAYFADYDWVVLCQLYGRMIDLPDGWPMFVVTCSNSTTYPRSTRT